MSGIVVHRIAILAALAMGTAITRFLPFLLFPAGKEIPPFMAYLGKTLPYATIGLLVVYCLKGVSLSVYPFGMAEGIAVLGVVLLHVWKRNPLISIGAGTVLYMVLVQAVFA